MPESPYRSWEQVWEDLGGKPSEDEIARLRKYYPRYEFPRRLPLLEGLLWGGTDKETTRARLKAEGIDADALSRRAFTTKLRWTRSKMRRAVLRVLYLRFRCDEKMVQIAANQQLAQKFYTANWRDFESFQSFIRKHTHSPILDS